MSGRIAETVRGVVERVTYHNPDNGWSVLRLAPFGGHGEIVTVTVHQTRVFAGATMEFSGSWTVHPKFGRQFKAESAQELKPATAGALEKYLGSGLIKGVGPKTARRIVRHFGKDTLDVFENSIDRLVEVPGIAEKKLSSITSAWQEHCAVRDVMMFLQSHGISTLFAVRIYKQYGDEAIAKVSGNPYLLAVDFYGIGFFSADKIALSIGFAQDSPVRITAAIRHVLSASREQGHCYLTLEQITGGVTDLLHLEGLPEVIPSFLQTMENEEALKVRQFPDGEGVVQSCYYSKTLYFAEQYVANRLAKMVGSVSLEKPRVTGWLSRYEQDKGMQLSPEQSTAVTSIVGCRCAVLTGGPGCGKTTATRALVSLLFAMGRSVLLAAPTGRAAQRMGEVVGVEAKTIHRLLEFQGRGFKRNQDNPLQADNLIVDECSMLDITLTASLLQAVGPETSVLFIGDADQLPSVGAGNVLRDLITSGALPCFTLSTVFRQARESEIITFAHQINRGEVPWIKSPFKHPDLWKQADCFFMDSDEATQAQLRFIRQVTQKFGTPESREALHGQDPRVIGTDVEPVDYASVELPEQFRHVDLQTLATAERGADKLAAVSRKVHPWSSLYYGLTAIEVIRNLYTTWIPRYYGSGCEIQVLSPMIRGSLGTASLNVMLQREVNPPRQGVAELTVGERIFRVGDRVIHRRNNYDLSVFNGDIGVVLAVNTDALTLDVCFSPDDRQVCYQHEQLSELEAAYAITIHKSQGSEFDVVILPVLTQHFRMLFRNLLYTGITRAKRLVVLVGTRRALAMAVANQNTGLRQTGLANLLGVSV